jgi:ABC-type sugar transport system ATPase subunit
MTETEVSVKEKTDHDASPGGEFILKAEHISKTYNRTLAVNDCSIRIGYGEIVSLVGGNGAGKSTLTRIISGVTTPDPRTGFRRRKNRF